MLSKSLVLTAAIVLLIPSFMIAQNNRAPLTNADVINMIKGGVPEKTVVMAIQTSAGDYDTSPQALIKLKEHGATQAIFEAILLSGKPSQTLVGNKQVDQSEVGVFFRESSGKLIELGSPPEPKSKSKTSVLGGLAGVSPDVVNVYESAEAPTRIPTTRPELVINLGPTLGTVDPRTVWIVALDRKNKTREVRISSVGWEATLGVRDKDRRDAVVTRTEKGWTVVPKGSLVPGEYLLTLDPYLGQAYEFGIDPPK